MSRPLCATSHPLRIGESLSDLLRLLRGDHRRDSQVDALEHRFAKALGAASAVSAPMARMALDLILGSNALRPGDKILLSPANIPEMRAIVELRGLVPVYADFTPGSIFPDPVRVRDLAASGVRAFLLTIVAGQGGDLAEIRRICDQHGILLILDATQAVGGRFQGRPLHQFAHFSFFSTCEFKWVHGYRGALVLSDSEERLASLRTHARRSHPDFQRTGPLLRKWFSDSLICLVLLSLRKGSWIPLLTRFLRAAVFTQDPLAPPERSGVRVGPFRFLQSDFERMKTAVPQDMRFRLSDFEAIAALRSLRRLGQRITRHQEIARRYDAAFGPMRLLPARPSGFESTFWRYPLLFKDPRAGDRFLEGMRDRGIFVERSGLSLLPEDAGSAPEARSVMARTILLPCHEGLSDADCERVVQSALSILVDPARPELK